MEKIIDIYGYFKDKSEMYNRSKGWFGRIIVNERREAEGIVCKYDNHDEESLVFGTVEDDIICLTECPRNVDSSSKELLAEQSNRSYIGVCSQIDGLDDLPVTECKIILMPADKTREESDFELDRLKSRIEIIKSEIPRDSKSLYHAFRIENKMRQKTKK